MNYKFIICLFLLAGIYSCQSPKNIAYFQDIKSASQSELDSMYARYSARICPDDQLGIIVSSKNLAAVAPYNLPAVSFMSPSTLTTVSGRENTPVMPSANQPYLVDSEGYIQFPVLGRIKLGGLTKKEAVKLLETLISEDVKEPIVTIQHMNFKVSVLGEVLRPGPFFLTNDRISILDAVALAGDLTIYGQRENVLLIRDNNGQKVFHYFDLTKSDIFKSPFFYLQQNDVIYIEPNKSRKRTTRYNQADQYNISVASTILSGISVFVALFVSVRK